MNVVPLNFGGESWLKFFAPSVSLRSLPGGMSYNRGEKFTSMIHTGTYVHVHVYNWQILYTINVNNSTDNVYIHFKMKDNFVKLHII